MTSTIQRETILDSDRQPPGWRSVVSVRWAALALFVAGLGAQLAGAAVLVWWVLYLACYITGGWASAWTGVQALRRKALDVDLLMVSPRSVRPRSGRFSTVRC
jgi:cobalt/nickel-transporting P-type ATPase D